MKLETERLLLEPFSLEHLDGLHAINSDPDVMRYLGPINSIEETQEGISRVAERWERLGVRMVGHT